MEEIFLAFNYFLSGEMFELIAVFFAISLTASLVYLIIS